MPKDWSALDEVSVDERMQTQAQLKEDEDKKIKSLMHSLVSSNPAAIKYLAKRFIDTGIAVPGDDMLTIGIRQGQANMIKWIMNKANQE